MKRMAILLLTLVWIAALSACAMDNNSASGVQGQDGPEKIHDDVAAENIRSVHVSGNARSVVLRQSADESFAFYNGDLNAGHTYEVDCDEDGGAININIMMESQDDNNDILGSVVIDIPQKEFENIEIAGDFSQIYLYTLNSDVLVHANNAFVNLDLEADLFKHSVTLDGAEPDAFKGASIYWDKFPDHVNLDLDLSQGGTINDPDDWLKENDSGIAPAEPAIHISDAKVINIYKTV